MSARRRRLSDASPEQIRKEAAALKERRARANRNASPFLVLQWTEAVLVEQGLVDLETGDEVLEVVQTQGNLFAMVRRGQEKTHQSGCSSTETIQWWWPDTRVSTRYDYAAVGGLSAAMLADADVSVEFSTPSGTLEIRATIVGSHTVRFVADEDFVHEGVVCIEVLSGTARLRTAVFPAQELLTGVEVEVPFDVANSEWEFRVGDAL